MSGYIKSKFEQEIGSEWSDFVKDCITQVKTDKDDLKNNKIAYFPSAEICSKPDFCLIAMEPPLNEKKLTINQIEKEVQDGHKIFFPPIVSYCAFRYLCNGKYNFYITDLDKGAKKINNDKLWDNWLPLLKKELKLLGNPVTISLGKDLWREMCKNGLEVKHWVYHYAMGRIACRRRKKYELIKKEFPREDMSFETLPKPEDIKKYTKELKEKFGAKFAPSYYTAKQIENDLEEDFSKSDFSEDEKILLAYYRYEFTRIRKEWENERNS